MRNFDEATITDAVLQRVRAAKDDRIRQVSEALVRHLHAFVREIEPTQAEWEAGIDFLTRTGQMCDDKRQEFILLSDTLGVSMLVDAINHRTPEGATETTVLGPFYVQHAPEHPLGADISGTMEGAPLLVTGTVSAAGGKPLAGAVVDVWHSDNDGYYDVQQLDEIGDLAMRARFRTDENGRFWFWSIKPAAYPIPHDGPVGKMLEAQGRHPWRPAHVHFMIAAPGHETLVTHVFVAGDQYLDSDVVFGVKDSLIREFAEMPASTAPDGREMAQPYYHLNYDFGLKADFGNAPRRRARRLDTSRRDHRRRAILDQRDRIAQHVDAGARLDAVLRQMAAEGARAGHAVKRADEMPRHRVQPACPARTALRCRETSLRRRPSWWRMAPPRRTIRDRRRADATAPDRPPAPASRHRHGRDAARLRNAADAAIDDDGHVGQRGLEPIDQVVIERRDVAVFLRRQALQPGFSGMHDQRVGAGRDHAARQHVERNFRILVVDADPAFDRDRNCHRALHGRDAIGDQRRLRHQAGAEAAVLHPVGRTADIEIDLVVAEVLADLRGGGEVAGSEPPSCSATGCSLGSKPSSRLRSP